MIVFEKYRSIENSYREKFISLIRETKSANDVWYITSKIHGSNFAIIYDGKEFQFAKRGGLLDENENFYGHKEVVASKLQGIRDYYDSEIARSGDSVVTYYGEIFGPGVQKGVNYGKKDFRFFDITVGDGSTSKWIKQSQLYDFETKELKMVPELGYGSLDYALEYNCEFDSKILNITNNPEEGIVMKPNNTAFLDHDNRIILKKKHPKFSEIAKESDIKKEKTEIPKEFSKYITSNRLENVLSKIVPSFRNFNLILSDFVSDIVKESTKDNPDNVFMDGDTAMLCPSVESMIKPECAKFVREEIKKRQ